MKKTILLLLILISLNKVKAQTNIILNNKQKSIVAISALTAKGNLTGLKNAMNDGLDAGMTVNEIKEIMIHLYAYCGFPRSLNGINTFIAVLNERKAKGVNDPEGTAPLIAPPAADKYASGKKILERLTGRPEIEPKRGYAAFLPAIDTLLKEHLFADVFGRGVLTDQERELTTVSALVSLGGVDSQLSGHLSIAMHTGLTEPQLKEMLAIQEIKIGKTEADAGRAVLTSVTTRRQ
ncbi:carboxymuconolactone decarboxylase family protein [Mucilaginibacter sp.]|uniref:carboxymuconolactone decarboxylase family protein n=1 Tax=Mucilaginibacter sp. TaxID=1882438 RepID=UPI0025E35465|nr:carboxymuconolactone decarboxylase family protein [Mucilaginibacter sp.]